MTKARMAITSSARTARSTVRILAGLVSAPREPSDLRDPVDDGDHQQERAHQEAEGALPGPQRDARPDPSARDDAEHQHEGDPPGDVAEGGVHDRPRDRDDRDEDEGRAERTLQRHPEHRRDEWDEDDASS